MLVLLERSNTARDPGSWATPSLFFAAPGECTCVPADLVPTEGAWSTSGHLRPRFRDALHDA